MTTITIVGLGYVGLPVACRCAAKGHTVFGLDIDERKITKVNAGESPIVDPYVGSHLKKGMITATDDPASCVPQSDVVLVCVPTPVDHDHEPNLGPVKGAVTAIAPHLRDAALLIIESTIYPGTVEEIVVPILEEHGKRNPVAHCPERIDPGNMRWTIENLPRVVGATTSEAAERAAEFYRSFVDADITVLSSVKAAEATKIMENTFRDINIAFVNEMAMSFDKAGIDITEVIRGASTKPFAFMPHHPGAGVGGHCISVDPYYLISKAKALGFNHRFLSLARNINEGMPRYAVNLLEGELGLESLEGISVGVLGLAYKPGVDDARESPAYDVIAELEIRKAKVERFDPYIPAESTASSIAELCAKVKHLIIVTAHKEFTTYDFTQHAIETIIDGRNCLDKESIKNAGIKYRGIGRR